MPWTDLENKIIIQVLANQEACWELEIFLPICVGTFLV